MDLPAPGVRESLVRDFPEEGMSEPAAPASARKSNGDASRPELANTMSADDASELNGVSWMLTARIPSATKKPCGSALRVTQRSQGRVATWSAANRRMSDDGSSIQ